MRRDMLVEKLPRGSAVSDSLCPDWRGRWYGAGPCCGLGGRGSCHCRESVDGWLEVLGLGWRLRVCRIVGGLELGHVCLLRIMSMRAFVDSMQTYVAGDLHLHRRFRAVVYTPIRQRLGHDCYEEEPRWPAQVIVFACAEKAVNACIREDAMPRNPNMSRADQPRPHSHM